MTSEELNTFIKKSLDTNTTHLLRTIHVESKIEALSELVIHYLNELNGTSKDVLRYKLEKLLEINLSLKTDVIDSLLDVNNKD